VVLAIAAAGVAARLDSPFAVGGIPPFLKGSYTLLLEGVSHVRLERLDRAVVAYYLAHGTVPRTLEDLSLQGFVDRSFLKDPWARPYHYALTQNGYLLNAVDDGGKTAPGTEIERALPPEKP